MKEANMILAAKKFEIEVARRWGVNSKISVII